MLTFGNGPGAVDRPATDQKTEIEGTESRDTVRAVHREGSVSIDGKLTEAAWGRAPVYSGFVQGRPVEGAEPEQQTRIRLLYDDRALYVGATMRERGRDAIHDRLTARDQPGQYDFFEVALDSNRDRRTGYTFKVSAAGVQSDSYLFDDDSEDVSWDAVWESDVSISDRGWSVELRIPLSQIRYERSEAPITWGANFIRRRTESNSVSHLFLRSREAFGRVSQFGSLGGLRLPEPIDSIEMRPYVLGQWHQKPPIGSLPGQSGNDASARVGLSGRYQIGSSSAVDMTVNPDFGQVEADPAVVNLSTRETFFPEKRQFFVEDARVFDFRATGSNGSLFYSRRIGAPPSRTTIRGADNAEVPDRTSILGAAKLTGRSTGNLSFGALAAVSGEEQGRAYYSGSDSSRRFLAEPRTGYGVVRVRQGLRQGATEIGAILTGTARDGLNNSSKQVFPSNALTGGVDVDHNWGGERNRKWALWGYFSGSLIRGAPGALERIQRSAPHYYQRPDAEYVEVDSTRRSIAGVDWSVQLERRSAEHWLWAVWLGQVSPGFNPDDLGFSQAADRLFAAGRIGYQSIEPGELFRHYEITLRTNHRWRHSLLEDPFDLDRWGDARGQTDRGLLWLDGQFEFINNWTAVFQGHYSPNELDRFSTRGGPLMTEPETFVGRVELQTDPRSVISLRPSVRWEKRREAGHVLEVRNTIVWKPVSWSRFTVTPRVYRERNPVQYVATSPDVGFEPTYGRRYLFGQLDRNENSLEVRANVALYPNLSIELFGQALLAAGDYGGFRSLQSPRTLEFKEHRIGETAQSESGLECVGGDVCQAEGEFVIDFDSDGSTDFSFSDPNFTRRELRAQAVLEWEYSPGSRLYVVWHHNRVNRDRDGGIGLGGIERLFDNGDESTIVVKASHWLSL